MEGVGARLGRSSTRYSGPATVFSGPVRKWEKKWVNVPSPNSNNHATAGNSPSHLLLYKWTPIPSQNGSSNNPSTPANGAIAADKDSATAASDATASVSEEPPRRKFRYVPVSELEEQKEEAAAKTDDETKQSNADGTTETETEGSDAKPDVNDIPMEESLASGKDQVTSQEASETSLDLSLGLKSHDGKREASQSQGDGSGGDGDAENKQSDAENSGKRKVPDLEMRV